VRVPYDHTAERVAARLSAEAEHLPEDLRRMLTWDQGIEMAAHAKFTIATGIPVYIPVYIQSISATRIHPGNTARTRTPTAAALYPKGTDLSSYAQVDLDTVAHKLNTKIM
jgi:transposase, IS30 family